MKSKQTGDQVMRPVYRALTEAEKLSMKCIKDDAAELWEQFNDLGESREVSIAKTKLEEAVMWAVKHITG